MTLVELLRMILYRDNPLLRQVLSLVVLVKLACPFLESVLIMLVVKILSLTVPLWAQIWTAWRFLVKLCDEHRVSGVNTALLDTRRLQMTMSGSLVFRVYLVLTQGVFYVDSLLLVLRARQKLGDLGWFRMTGQLMAAFGMCI